MRRGDDGDVLDPDRLGEASTARSSRRPRLSTSALKFRSSTWRGAFPGRKPRASRGGQGRRRPARAPGPRGPDRPRRDLPLDGGDVLDLESHLSFPRRAGRRKAGSATRGVGARSRVWAGRDSNPHASRHRILSPARLPVPPPARARRLVPRRPRQGPTVCIRGRAWARRTSTRRTGACLPACPAWAEGALAAVRAPAPIGRRCSRPAARPAPSSTSSWRPPRPGVRSPNTCSEEELVRLNLVVGRDTPEVLLDEWGIRCNLTFRGRRFDCAFPWAAVLARRAPAAGAEAAAVRRHPGRQEGLARRAPARRHRPAKSEPGTRFPAGPSSERGRNRTFNLWIKSPLLCQLSYAPC